MGEPLLRIGEIAAFFDVSVKAMRIYEKLGILTPERIDKNTGYRYYGIDQVKQLDALLDMRRLGFTLMEIKSLLSGGLTNANYTEALVHKRARWVDAISQAQERIESIDEMIAELSADHLTGKMHELTEDERARLLGRMVCVEDKHGRSVLSEALWL